MTNVTAANLYPLLYFTHNNTKGAFNRMQNTFTHMENPSDSMENTVKGQELKQIYNIVDWIDFGLVFAVIVYYTRLVNNLQDGLLVGTQFDFAQFMTLAIENANFIGIALLAASLAVCVTFICLTIKMWRRRDIGIVRATARIIWNMIWIPLDVYVLCMILWQNV